VAVKTIRSRWRRYLNDRSDKGSALHPARAPMEFSPPRRSTQRDRRSRLPHADSNGGRAMPIKVAREGRPSQQSRSQFPLPCTANGCCKATSRYLQRLHRGLNASAATRRRTPFLSYLGSDEFCLAGPTGVARRTCTYETAMAPVRVVNRNVRQALDAGDSHLETRSSGHGKHLVRGSIASPHYRHQLACS
jgi:hypothetical protein